MQARDIMTRRVVTLSREATLEEAVALMVRHRISGLPVTDAAGTVLGIVTEGDLLRRAETGTEHQRPRWLRFLLGPERLATEYVHTHSRKVKDVMTRNVITVDPDTSLDGIVDLMEKRHIKRVPVVEDGRLTGIVSRANLIQALASLAGDLPAATATDETIRARLWDELMKCDWAPVATLNVIVKDGTVHLHGCITDESERRALRVAAENVPGVRAVRDHLVWCDGMADVVLDLPEEEKLGMP